ncbi:Galactarate dehydratase, partial [Dysosmobacter welbionis]
LEPDALAAHLPLGGGNDVLRQPQPPGDGKGVGFAGNADQQPVGGRQRLHVELAGGVLHPCRSHGEGLQLRIVGGGGHLGPQPPHVLDDGDGQGRALH